MLFDPGACCNCGPPTPNATVIAYSCTFTIGREMAGAKVTVKRLGDVVAEAVTGVNGRADFYLPNLTVAHELTVEPPADLSNRYKTYSEAAWTPSNSGANPRRAVLLAADNMVCISDWRHPAARTLYLTLDGTYVLTWGGVASWTLITTSKTEVSPVYDAGTATCGLTMPVPITLRVFPSGGDNVARVEAEWREGGVGCTPQVQYTTAGGVGRLLVALGVDFSISGSTRIGAGSLTQGGGVQPCPVGTSFALSE